MKQTATQRRYSYAEYLQVDEMGPIKNEFLDGEIYAMAGGSPEHAELAATIITSLKQQLGGRCRIFSSDLRVRVTETGLATYPDVTVVCGPLETDPEGPASVINPTIVVEVLSDSTEEYDRGEKLAHYRRVPSLQAIIYVSQREPRLEMWRRQKTSWVSESAAAGEALELPFVGARLTVDAIYAGILG